MMEYLWLVTAVMAALAQSVRHAALKELNRHLPIAATTYVRMLFGLPFLGLYLWAVQSWVGTPLPVPGHRFWIFIVVTAVTQIAFTALMVRLFQLGNMAVGVMITRADVMLTAVVGTVLFSERISTTGWIAIAITFLGVLIASAGRLPVSAWFAGGKGIGALLFGPSIRVGLSCALIAALSYLSLREAILALDPAVSAVYRSAFAATVMTLVSFVVGGLYLVVTDSRSLAQIFRWPGISLAVGIASALGSIGWFTASALTNASYVAAVAQVQIVFVMLISRYWFRETIRPIELVGIAVILTGVLAFLFA